MPRTDLLRPLPELLRTNADRYGDRIAYADSRHAVTHGDLDVRTARLAGHLADAGLWPSDRVVVLADGVPAVEGVLAVIRAGGIAVPLDPALDDAELARLAEDSGAETVLTDTANAHRLPLPTVPAEGAETEPSSPARDDTGLDDLALLTYTAGTTGPRKGVLSTQRNVLWPAAAAATAGLGFTADDRVLWMLPGLACFGQLVAATAAGATVRFAAGPTGPEPRATAEHGTVLIGTGAALRALPATAGAHVRFGLAIGPVDDALHESFATAFGAPLLTGYAATETGGLIGLSWPGADTGRHCLPLPGLSVRVVDPGSGADLGPGQEGEVWVSGPNVMAGGYHNRTDDTAEVLRGGWYRTGDRARRDESGNLTVTGRLADRIEIAGDRVLLDRIDEVLRSVPAVADAAAGAGSDGTIAYVTGTGVDHELLLAACRAGLPTAAVPVRTHLVREIPRTVWGTPARHRLPGLPGRLLHQVAGPGGPHTPYWEPVPDTGAASDDVTVHTHPDAAALAGILDRADAGTRLVVVVDARESPRQAVVWGTARAYQLRHPGRLVLIDAVTVPGELLAAAVASGEDVLAVRSGALVRPRYTPVTTAPSVLSGTVLMLTRSPDEELARHLTEAHEVSDLIIAPPGAEPDADAIVAVDLTAEETITLHEATLGRETTRLVLLSSGTDVIATAVADAVARRRHTLGLPAVSLAWSAPGFAESPADRRTSLFDAAITDAACVVAARAVTIDAGAALTERLTAAPDSDRRTMLRDLVLAETATVLRDQATAAIDGESPFRQFGFDSLAAVQLRGALCAATGLDLPLTLVFDHPTPNLVADHLLEALGLAGPVPPEPETAARSIGEPIAIVGMACRYPGGVASPEDLWRLVRDEVDAVGAFPDNRGWDLAALHDGDGPGTISTRAGGFLHDAADFDAEFFGISPREALAMDPQQRLFLESSWEALEDAGIRPGTLRGSDTAVFAGVPVQAYGRTGHREEDGVDGFLVTGMASSVVSGRVAYAFGLEGPAVTVDTACSSSLVALHLAVQALRNGECSLALA
ncbi:beta-ketoacyl synthase N-terminal-like domain-containing protein, partial [Actinoplanes sp. NPDC049802]|uniref:beta-ketoacyl synthase N-terminal-like domain-containing protein n=1 Tax=Actinoplanes sp. NPDC049802 TaxID=3154742 RepID=UPI0034062E9A